MQLSSFNALPVKANAVVFQYQPLNHGFSTVKTPVVFCPAYGKQTLQQSGRLQTQGVCSVLTAVWPA